MIINNSKSGGKNTKMFHYFFCHDLHDISPRHDISVPLEQKDKKIKKKKTV